MNILCIICREVFTESEDVVYTVCGHVFHSACLTQWIKRSKSCPECRGSVTQDHIHKLYLNVSDNGISTKNDRQEWNKIEYLKVQIQLKEMNIKHFMSRNAILEKQNAGFRKEVQKLENDIGTKIFAVQSISEELKALKRQLSEFQKAKNKVTQLKEQMRFQRSINVLLDVSVEDVIDIIRKDSRSALITYVYQMKEEIVSNLSKINHLNIEVTDLQKKNAMMIIRPDVLSQYYSSNRQLEEQFAFCESEKMIFQSRVIELEKMLVSKRNAKKSKYSQPNASSNWCFYWFIPVAVCFVAYLGRQQIRDQFIMIDQSQSFSYTHKTIQKFFVDAGIPEIVPKLPVDAGIPETVSKLPVDADIPETVSKFPVDKGIQFVFSSLARLGTLLITITSDSLTWLARRVSSCLMFLRDQSIQSVFSSLGRLGTLLTTITSDSLIWVARRVSPCLMFLRDQGIPFVFSSLARLGTLLITITSDSLIWLARRVSPCLMFLGDQGIPFVFSSLGRFGTLLITITRVSLILGGRFITMTFSCLG